MIGNTIVEYLLSCLYENPLIRAETLNSAAGRDGMGKILLVFVAIIKSYLFHSDIWDLSRRYPAMWYKRYRDIYWRRYKIQETLYIGQWHFSPLQSRYLGTSQFSQSPSAALLYFPESHRWSEISSLSKVTLAFGKARSCRSPNLVCRVAESPGDLMICQKTLCETWCVSRHIVVMKLPITSCP